MRLPPFLRRAIDPLFELCPVPILSGVNRGRWWSLVSAGHGHVTGRRTRRQLEYIVGLIRPDDIVWDIGAHHGYVTLCAAARVGPGGCVHAFEPSARNRRILERHIRWNRIGNVVVHDCALGSRDGEERFGGSGTSKMLALGHGDDIVPVRRGRTLVEQGTCAVPGFLKLDVEGAEAEVVEGLLAVLPRHARLLIAVHSRESDRKLVELLGGAGFTLRPSAALRRARETPEWSSDPDLFCAGPDDPGRDRDAALLDGAGF